MMAESTTKEIFNGIAENFQKAKVLIEETSKTDPDTNPYKSKYTAKEILEKIKQELKNIISSAPEVETEHGTSKCILALVDLTIGIIDLETEDLPSAERQFDLCVEAIKDAELRRENILCATEVLNRQGLLWSERTQPEKAKEYLLKSENMYNKYIAEVGKPPFDIFDLLHQVKEPSNPVETKQKLEKIYTHTLFYLGQVYQGLQEPGKSADCFKSTLRRQLELKDYDPVDWALNAATLAQFYLTNDAFVEARFHLACATVMIERYEVEVKSKTGTENSSENEENVLRRRADLSRCWGKYCINLLLCSRDNLMNKQEHELVQELEKAHLEGKSENQGDSSGFGFLDISSILAQTRAHHVMDFESARGVFLQGQNYLNQAKQYYTKDDRASDFIEIILDHSRLFQYLTFFEENGDRQCKMLKRRVDMLQDVLKDINPQYYLTYCRQIQFELGEIYSDMMDIKLAMTEAGERERNTHTVMKVNQLINESIKHYTMFLDTFKDINGKMSETFPNELTRPALIATFCSARLNSKIITNEKSVVLENIQKSLDGYKFVVDYCSKNNDVAESMKQELGICREMVNLLPLKMEKIADNSA